MRCLMNIAAWMCLEHPALSMLPKSRQAPREGSTGARRGTHVSARGFDLSSEVRALTSSLAMELQCTFRLAEGSGGADCALQGLVHGVMLLHEANTKPRPPPP